MSFEILILICSAAIFSFLLMFFLFVFFNKSRSVLLSFWLWMCTYNTIYKHLFYILAFFFFFTPFLFKSPCCLFLLCDALYHCKPIVLPCSVLPTLSPLPSIIMLTFLNAPFYSEAKVCGWDYLMSFLQHRSVV